MQQEYTAPGACTVEDEDMMPACVCMLLAALGLEAASYMPETARFGPVVDDERDLGLALLLLLLRWLGVVVFRRGLRPLCGIGCHYTAM